MNTKMNNAAVLVLCLVGFASSSEWNYNHSSPKGPEHWADFHSKCGGKSQSPINILTNMTSYDSTLGNLRFVAYDSVLTDAKVVVKNNGHTLVVSLLSGNYYVSEGGLSGRYRTVQFHFHWGSTNDKGSEHLVDGKAYPGVIHIVSYNTKYASFDEAKPKPDGLAVVGVFIKVGDENAGLNVFLNSSLVDQLINEANTSAIPQVARLDSLLPETKDFYRYNGSLTTPSCDQSVTWTVMKYAVSASETQLNQLRKLKNDIGKPVSNNFRPTMALNGRVVYTNFDTAKPTAMEEPTTTKAPTAKAVTMVASGLTVTMAMLLTVFLKQ